MKTKRNLSGVFTRCHNQLKGKYENVCFEDLEQMYQKDLLKNKSKEWVESLCLRLADTLNEIGENFDL